MRCPTCNGGTDAAPCVCATEAELYNEAELTLDDRFLIPPRDPRDEYTHPEDCCIPVWMET